MSATGNEIFGWLRSASVDQRRTLLAASLGWMLDSMDVMLYTLVLGQVQREMHLSAAMSGAMMSATLVSAAAGGIAFGWIADRFGRVRALTWSILGYSVFTALCGLAQSPWQFLLCRILLGLGMGGEWASGAAMVAEIWPAHYRAKALSVVQSSWAVGYAAGAGLVALILPHFGWRAVFFAGIAPALIAVWLQRTLHEPVEWTSKHASRPPIAELFRGALGRSLLVCSAMNAAALFAYWGLFTWMPHFLSQPVAAGGHGLSIVATSGWTILIQTGTFVGYVSFGYLADRFGRKPVYIGYLLAAAGLAPLFAFVDSPALLLVIGPLVGFFGTGYFSGFSVISSELFPAPLRGSAMGFAYNIGRLASAAAPYAIGKISEAADLRLALSITAAGFLAAALIATQLRLSAPPAVREVAPAEAG